MLARNSNNVAAELTDEDYVSISIPQEDSPEEKMQLNIEIKSPSPISKNPSNGSFTSSASSRPISTSPALISPLSAIRLMFFTPEPGRSTPKAGKDSIEIKWEKELEELQQVLTHTATTIEHKLSTLSKSDLTLEVLKNLQGKINANDATELLCALDQQKRYITKLSWMTYLPTCLAVILPPVMRLPFAACMYLMCKTLDKNCFNDYTSQLNTLSHIAHFQENVIDKSHAGQSKLARYVSMKNGNGSPEPSYCLR